MRYMEDGYSSSKKLVSILLMSLLLCGVVAGVYLMCKYSQWDYIHTKLITQGFTEDTSSRTLLDVFLNASLWTVYSLVIVYLCGYSAIGHPVSLFVLLLRGIALGVSVSTIYLSYGSRGILVLILMVMVHAVVSTMVLVSATVVSLRQSTMVAYAMLGRSSETVSIRRYSLKFLCYASIVIVSSLVDTLLTYLFIDMLLVTD